ncbi:MAG: hypothetical protein DBX55_00565 [Verrucomicrobia bacterium]|nr:MAG: hypothetical protein DBX55_00565 [Verrucomicrobiota bacterium]
MLRPFIFAKQKPIATASGVGSNSANRGAADMVMAAFRQQNFDAANMRIATCRQNRSAAGMRD